MNTFESDSVVRRAFWVALLALAVLPASALAQNAGGPSVKVGDQWQFVIYYGIPSTEPNRSWVINSITAAGIEGTENGKPLMLTSDLNVLESPWLKDSNPKALSFPIEVGKQWRYTSVWVFKVKGSTGSSVVDVAVVGHEKITVPAGEFDAFKLVAKGPSRTSHREVGVPQPVHRDIHPRTGRLPSAALIATALGARCG
jgi:hypothetical protein